MSFREKTAWVSLLAMGGIYGAYFWSVMAAGHAALDGGRLLGTIVALVAVEIVFLTVIALFAPKDARAPRDERDRLIELRATRVAYAGLATAVVFACFFAAFKPPIVFGTNSLLFILVVCEMMRMAVQIVQYRRQA